MSGSKLVYGMLCLFLFVIVAAAFDSVRNFVASRQNESQPARVVEPQRQEQAIQLEKILAACRQLSPELQSIIEKTETQLAIRDADITKLANELILAGQQPSNDPDYQNWMANQVRCKQRLKELLDARRNLYLKKVKLELAPDQVEQDSLNDQIQQATRTAKDVDELLEQQIRVHNPHAAIELPRRVENGNTRRSNPDNDDDESFPIQPRLTPSGKTSTEPALVQRSWSAQLPPVTPASASDEPPSVSPKLPAKKFLPLPAPPPPKPIEAKRPLVQRWFGWFAPKRPTHESGQPTTR